MWKHAKIAMISLIVVASVGCSGESSPAKVSSGRRNVDGQLTTQATYYDHGRASSPMRVKSTTSEVAGVTVTEKNYYEHDQLLFTEIYRDGKLVQTKQTK